MRELEFRRETRRGDRGASVGAVQEWLSLHGFNVRIDDDFGPATQTAIRKFQTRKRLPVTGAVDAATWAALVAPARSALAPIRPNGASLARLVVAYARQHLRQRPREIGGQNRGPWVRLYMDGNEGDPWPWCAGFATFVVRQAAETLGAPMPIDRTYSCDIIAASAKNRGRFIGERDHARSRPGDLFLSRRTSNDWSHVGIVVSKERETFGSVEGNTNDEGSFEGYEVCARTRGYPKRDFVRI